MKQVVIVLAGMTLLSRFRCLALAAAVATAETCAFGFDAIVRSKAELLDAIAGASDGRGRLVQDVAIAFAADCAPIVVGEGDLWNESEKCLLDCGGRRICLDAGRCPSGTVVVGDPEGGRKEDRLVAIKGCGEGSVFRNLTVVNHGRLEFNGGADTLVWDCDFINCGADNPKAGNGGAIKGCASVVGCGFERCRALAGGALSDCGYVGECLFVDCSAPGGGGAIAGATDVFRCEFRRCSSRGTDDGCGGAVFGGRDIVSCLFVDCSSVRGGAIMSAGKGHGSRTKAVHCTFIRCRGELSGEAVYESAEGAPVFMLNCLSFGCSCWQYGADMEEKYNCYQLVGTDFFLDYANGDFHPHPGLAEGWSDPCGLAFGDCGEEFFACRDLDGYGYQLSSPWPVCPGCYRFRATAVSEEESPDGGLSGLSKYVVVKPKKSANMGHWRKPAKKPQTKTSDFGNSVRNRPPKVVSHRAGQALLDLSELPCVITQNEILHEGDDLLSFVSPWYEEDADGVTRFFELYGPLKMPKVGVDAGYGCPGEMLPYEEDEELKALDGKYGFRPGWFHRKYVRSEDKLPPRYSILKDRACPMADPHGLAKSGAPTNVVEKIPFLFSPAKGKGKFPLVVYIAGRGEQGTDLKKMFRQTGVFDAVREPDFARGHPCHLLAIMPPEFVHGCFVSYPHSYSFCRGAYDDIPSYYNHKIAKLYIVQLYADLVFGIQRELQAKGQSTVDEDAIVLVGLGTGSSAAVTMMREYPGRYAGVCVTWPSEAFQPTANRYRPGRWWYAMKEQYHEIDDKIDKMAEVYRKAGADLRLSYYPDGPNWWNRQYESPEFAHWLVECFEKGPLHGEKLVVSRPKPETGLLMAKTGPYEVTYYGTLAERPGGLPKEVADKLVENLDGIRYLYIDGKVGAIPPEAFARSADLETVHFQSYYVATSDNSAIVKCNVTNVAERAFADSPNLKLVVWSGHAVKIAADAFDGCAPSLYGATLGIPSGYSSGRTNATSWTKKISPDALALPVDGLFGTHIFLCDDQLGRRLYIEGDFLWSEEEEGANALMYLGEGRDVFVPETLGGRPVVTLGRRLLHRRGGFEYGILAMPESVRHVNFSPIIPHVQKLFASGEIPSAEIRHVLGPDTIVYGTTPREAFGRLVPWPLWTGTEVVVPKGTSPRGFFAAMRKE